MCWKNKVNCNIQFHAKHAKIKNAKYAKVSKHDHSAFAQKNFANFASN